MDTTLLEGLRIVGPATSRPFRAGERPSLRTGLGFDFADYRRLQTGDSLRHLDWRRYLISHHREKYVRHFYTELSSAAAIIVDASGSMTTYPAADAKFACARELASTFTWLGVLNRECVDVAVVPGLAGRGNDAGLRSWEKLTSESEAAEFTEQLKTCNASGVTDAGTLEEAVETLGGHYGVAVLISDALMYPSELSAIFRTFAERATHVHLVRLVGKQEQEPAPAGSRIEAIDAETGEMVETDFDLAGYRSGLEHHFELVGRTCIEHEVNHAEIVAEANLSPAALLEALLNSEVVEEVH